ncbi:MAG TPA: phage tail protein [Polyangia bacterium]|nr:phage tail protein [Polyangia bacterium]
MTQAAALLPPVPAPPHDPLSIVLDVRAGWRSAGKPVDVEMSPLDCALALSPAPGGTAALADGAGTFGGLVLPDNAAFGPQHLLLLLDRQTTRLLRFDPCSCAFVKLPCIAGRGSKPRELSDPGGMVTSCGNLFICDGGNARVQVFGLRGLPLRAIWRQPPAAKLSQPWLPVAIAADVRGRLYVGDRNNGVVHVFAGSGRWLHMLDGLGAIAHLTVDRQGRLYVQVEGDAQVVILDPDMWPATHLPLELQARADEVARHFAPLPIGVTPDGDLQLATLCAAAGGASASTTFDATGAPVTQPPAFVAQFQTGGSFTTVALDSALYRCTWDRLELDGDFPAGTTLQAAVYTAETQIPDALIATLPDDAWSDCPPLSGPPALPGAWDCMLRAPQGRFLWLRLRFGGDGQSTPRVRRVRVVFPRVSLRRYLPATFGSDVNAAEFTDRFLAIFDRTFRGIESTIDWQARFYDPLSAPADDRNPSRDFLSWLATWLGVTLDRSWPIARRRRYLKEIGKLLPLRGTLPGLRRNLQLYLGLPSGDECKKPVECGPCAPHRHHRWRPPQLVLENFRLRRWLFLGHGRLGNEARVWGDSIVNRSRLDGKDLRGNAQIGVTQLKTSQDPLRDPFWVYAHKFTVFAPASFARSASAKRGLDRLIRAERPAHAAYQIVYVEPRMRIGVQSMIGFDTAVGTYPDANIRLDQAHLGRATVLGGDAPGDSITVGQRARIGTATRLT